MWSSSGKREQRGDTELLSTQHCGLLCGNSYLIEHHGDHRGIFRPQTLGGWLWWKRWEGSITTSTQILADEIHTCSAQVIIPISNFACLQKQVEGALWPGNSVGDTSAWFMSSDELCQPSSPVCPRPGEVLSHSPTCYGECLPIPSDQRKHLKPLYPSDTWAEMQAGRAKNLQSRARGRGLGVWVASSQDNKELYQFWRSFTHYAGAGYLIHSPIHHLQLFNQGN